MDIESQTKSNDPLAARRIYQLLVVYRWLSLIPAGLALLAGQGGIWPLIVAALGNLFISLFPKELNAALRRRPWSRNHPKISMVSGPWLLLVDLAFCAGLARWPRA